MPRTKDPDNKAAPTAATKHIAAEPPTRQRQGSQQAQSELDRLRLEVYGVHQYQKGLTAFLLIIGVFAAITIAWFTWLGFSGLIDRTVEEQVGNSVDLSLQLLQQIASTAESSALRAEAVATSSALTAATVQAGSESVSVASTQSAVKEGAGEWILVVAALPDREQALSEVDRILRAGYSSAVYHLGDDYVVAVGTFATEIEAKTAGLAVRSTLRVSPDIFDLTEVCPFKQFLPAGYFACYLSPISTPTP